MTLTTKQHLDISVVAVSKNKKSHQIHPVSITKQLVTGSWVEEDQIKIWPTRGF